MTNIQHLFSRIRLANVRGYLLRHGWDLSPDAPAAQVLFLGPMHDAGARYELFFPAEESHPKFRDRVLRSVFNLSCIEDREPIEIAKEMLAASDPANEQVASPAPSSGREVLSYMNRSSDNLRFCMAQAGIELILHPGDAIEIQVQRSRAGASHVEFGDRQFALEAAEADRIYVFQSQLGAGAAARRPATAHSTVDHELAGAEFQGVELPSLLQEMRSILSRADFALGADASAAPRQIVLQQAALIVASLAQRLPGCDQGTNVTEALWRIACRTLNRGGIALRIQERGEHQLHSAAMSDDELAPHQTLAWLEENAA